MSLGDGPIQSEYYEEMNAIAHSLDEIFNGDAKGKDRKTGFVLFVFPYGPVDGRANYISNGANREDIVRLFEEQIKRFKGELK